MRRLQAELQAAQDQALAQRQQAAGLGGSSGGLPNKRQAIAKAGDGTPTAKQSIGQGDRGGALSRTATLTVAEAAAAIRAAKPAGELAKRGPVRGAGAGASGVAAAAAAGGLGSRSASIALQQPVGKLEEELNTAKVVLDKVRSRNNGAGL